MATDRTTLPRGPYPNAGQRPTAPNQRRMPGAPRERKPVLAALAVLLIAGGAAVSALLVMRTGHKVPAIEISADVGAGQQIPLTSMQEVQVASDSGFGYVPWSARFQVARYYAGDPIPAGTLLTARMVVPASQVTAGRQVLGLTLKPGQVPGALRIGDHVDIYDTNTAQNSCPGTPGGVLSHDAVVTGLAIPSSGSGSSNVAVDIALNPPDAGAVVCNTANGWAGIAILPAGGGQAQPSPTPAAPPPARAAPRAGLRKRRVTTPPATPVTSASPSAPASPAGTASPGGG